ncbi:MAG: hypothetical protein F4X98_08700 [Gammaproteobacteria bacterium]|nr:hypothetical protein [Gammaproteobacteria bacterium]
MRTPLKQPAAMFEPDPRSVSLARLDAAGTHPNTLSDHHRDIAGVQMTAAVPEAIREEFETVRNLYLYSWHVYEFTVPAVLYALALVEKAIKEKCRRSGVQRPKHEGLKGLLKLSIREGWLANDDFPFALGFAREEILPAAAPKSTPTIRSVRRYAPTGTGFCELLAENLPELRNSAAHGDAGLGFPATALRIVEVCACVANGLFRDSLHPNARESDQPTA